MVLLDVKAGVAADLAVYRRAYVAEPPGLFQLKCSSRTLKGSNTLKSE
jgi:hypothetical protein